ncbi:hypothetical protein BIU82_17245 [Arthrobacter sp. SW1]|uniref:hypothetical protein n=1 Tax=Arthrobacter sp. SW1 TaxID=1920889 RepID=UPI000877D2E0|nr:hypothetical protein [Arthrobacter sp. SW1]OFI38809.1 hypothetical protein BIU82_17245 [Arthrobacter sp. SW1]
MTEQAPVPPKKKGNWGAKIILILVALVFAVISYFALAAFLPRWWSQTIGQQVNGSISGGILAGMFYGFVFTFAATLVALIGLNKKVGWPFKIALVILGVAISTPNLLTLAIALGSDNAAHAGQRVLDVDAPGFRTSTLISAIAGFAAAVLLVVLIGLWRGRGRKMKALKQAEKERLQAEKEAERAAAGRPTSGPAAALGDAKARITDVFDGSPDFDGQPDQK